MVSESGHTFDEFSEKVIRKNDKEVVKEVDDDVMTDAISSDVNGDSGHSCDAVSQNIIPKNNKESDDEHEDLLRVYVQNFSGETIKKIL